MKKNYFLFIVFAFMSMQMVYAQSFSKDELKKYSGQGNKSDEARAAELAQENPLNDQYELVLSCVKEYSGQSKKELYNKIYNWIINLSSNSQSAIQVADTAKWIIQTRCNIQQIAKRTMGDNRYKVNIRPLLTFDFKDEKIRFTFNLQSYDVLKKTDDDGGIFMMGNIGFFDGGGQKKDNQVWPLSECYPYAKKPSHPKVTSSRALVNSVAAYKILIDRVDGVLKKVVSNSDW
jgi:hypothetical protein